MRKLLLTFGILWSAAAGAATITVSSTGDSGSGSLRAAIAEASTGDQIIFDASLADQTIVLSTTLEIPVGKELTIDGQAAPNLKISGNEAVRVFLLKSTSVQPTKLILKNLTIINGYTEEYGAGVRSEHQGILEISGCTFMDNNAHQGGSAIFSHFEGRATIEECVFTNNVSIALNDERGSTVMLWGPGSHVVRNSTFTGNRGINGAAINGLNAQLQIEGCVFTNNKTTDAVYATGQNNPTLRGFGGAIYADRASPGGTSTALGSINVRDCEFRGNEAQSDGGACYLYTDATDDVLFERCEFDQNKVYRLTGGASLTGGGGGAIEQMNNAKNRGFVVRESTFSNNEAAVCCGAIRADWADTRVENCTFDGNKALLTELSGGTSANGGAIGLFSMTNSTVDIVNSTFANNYAGWVGGAIAGPASVRIKNNIFFQNTAGNGGNTWNIQQHASNHFTDLGNNLQFPDKANNLSNNYNVSTSVTIADPMLQELADNGGPTPTMALQAGSPAIDAGSGCPATDQRGYGRVGTCDIGAFEFGGLVTGVEGPSTALEISIFPNPANGGRAQVLLPGLAAGQELSVVLLDSRGAVARRWRMVASGQALELDLPGLPQGLYLLVVEHRGGASSSKLAILD